MLDKALWWIDSVNYQENYMKANLFNQLLIPAWLAIFSAVICFYWGYKFHNQAIGAEVNFSSLEETIKAIECPTLNKNGIFAIMRKSVGQGQRFADLFQAVSIIFLGLGIINFSLVLRHLKSRSSG